MAPLFKNWVGGSSVGKYEETPDDCRSDRPSTFGKLRNRPKLRPDDESVLYTTHIKANDAKDRDGTDVESYEMDQHTGNYVGDSGSETRIIPPHGEAAEARRMSKREMGDGKNVVRVNTEYQIEHSDRISGGK
jgi:hypothetical protein